MVPMSTMNAANMLNTLLMFLPANRTCRTSDPPILLGSSLSVFPASDILTFSHLLPLC